MECPKKILDAFNSSGIFASGGAVNNYTSGIISSLIELGLMDKQLQHYKDIYKERMIIICKILKENLPSTCSFLAPEGGYFVWIKLPDNIDGNKFNEFALEKYKVFTISGDRFSIDKNFKNYIRITNGFHTKDVLCDAVKNLCNALNDYLTQS